MEVWCCLSAIGEGGMSGKLLQLNGLGKKTGIEGDFERWCHILAVIYLLHANHIL